MVRQRPRQPEQDSTLLSNRIMALIGRPASVSTSIPLVAILNSHVRIDARASNPAIPCGQERFLHRLHGSRALRVERI
jgi:hypothetical protein